MTKPIKKLGVFDSGIGGLSVLKELTKLPIQEFVYFADTAHLPYGEKTQEHIQQLTLNAVSLLCSHNVDAVVIACHTASANAYDYVRSVFPDMPIFDVVRPAVDQALTVTKNNRIGIIGTQATINSALHHKKIMIQEPKATVITQACPQFVPLIEAGLKDKDRLKHALKMYLEPMYTNKVDTLLIGCTHYELIIEEIDAYLASSIQLISIPPLMRTQLTTSNMVLATQPSIQYLVSGDIQQFASNAQVIAQWPIDETMVEKVTVHYLNTQNKMLIEL